MVSPDSHHIIKNLPESPHLELLERSSYLENLANHYHRVEKGNGHTIFLMGEAGFGKTSLVNQFLKEVESTSTIYIGACDSLFTPRPLGPLYDIAGQVGQDFIDVLKNEKDRSLVFTTLGQKLSTSEKTVVLVFEDIHWADEATIDLIKFISRRISRYKCLFLLTYRDDEIHSRHRLATIFGELPPGDFSKVRIEGFSREMVDRLAGMKGYTTGEQLYSLTGGNPFYVMEILAREGFQIPERVKDSILTRFHSRGDDTKALWELLSILPSSRIDLNCAKRIESDFANCMDACIAAGVIVSRPGHLSFKHELFRIAIEESLSAAKRKLLHRKMLDIIHESAADSISLAQLVHHAKFANEREMVSRIAPQAASEAAAVGAHIEASKLYYTAIEYTDKHDPIIVELYERHAYECYLINQIKEALVSQEIVSEIWKTRKVNLKIGDSLRFLSRLWWFAGDHEKAIAFASQSIEILENGFPTRERALAYSNLSQLSMLCEDRDNTLRWGNKAIDLATRMDDAEIVSHALNNVGSILLKTPATEDQGKEYLNRSLSIALEKGFQEHVARAYVNLSSSFLLSRRYEKAMAIFEVGLKYCEERDLDSWKCYMYSCKVRALFETGRWEEAETLAKSLENNLRHPSIVSVDAMTSLARIAVRQGKFEEAKALIQKAKIIALPTREAQRIIPVLVAALELVWISGDVAAILRDEIHEAQDTLFPEKNNSWHYADLAYWSRKCGLRVTTNAAVEFAGPFKWETKGNWKAGAELWKKTGCPYEQALALMEGDEEHQKQGLLILDLLGATATANMFKSKLKLKGVRNIRRGPRRSTRNNPAQLTTRELEILVSLREGAQNKEIAEKLFISPKTVDHHISAILSKLEVKSRVKAVLEAGRLGILK